ncbi:hypothetical protein KVF89_25210 [Nocardioides carbamazepini]|uniref:hypothetical protein n=1 Tax=Nocardioides carbamazepini TaxID=2854259 RepID=UPI002149DC44|nr:hypothetical protein [Nocardioides carbamazepini]MCR1785859.1 hypothetical protein [Nocardioides carbamazepini]
MNLSASDIVRANGLTYVRRLYEGETENGSRATGSLEDRFASKPTDDITTLVGSARRYARNCRYSISEYAEDFHIAVAETLEVKDARDALPWQVADSSGVISALISPPLIGRRVKLTNVFLTVTDHPVRPGALHLWSYERVFNEARDERLLSFGCDQMDSAVLASAILTVG